MEEQFNNDIFGGIQTDTEANATGFNPTEFNTSINATGFNPTGFNTTVNASSGTEFNLPTKVSVWTKIKNFLFQDVKVELTPKQQKVEDEINEFLHQDVTWGKVKSFLFHEVKLKK